MPYFDEFIHIYGWNMSILWSPLKIWMPKDFTAANFRHTVSKSWLRHCTRSCLFWMFQEMLVKHLNDFSWVTYVPSIRDIDMIKNQCIQFSTLQGTHLMMCNGTLQEGGCVDLSMDTMHLKYLFILPLFLLSPKIIIVFFFNNDKEPLFDNILWH